MDELISLARAAGRGDHVALARLVRETQGEVWRLCAHLVDPAAADDLAQDTYLRRRTTRIAEPLNPYPVNTLGGFS